jgi:penicillin V acylase-like amidase (Ntn superfamily)
VIHHGREYQVMTNSPRYEQQRALAKYWEQIGGTTMRRGRTGRQTGFRERAAAATGSGTFSRPPRAARGP